MHDYHPTNNIDFDSVDWMALLKTMGTRLTPNTPVIIDMLTDEQRFIRASEYTKHILGFEKIPKNYVRDRLDSEIEDQLITTFDKAWIVLHVNRMLKDLDFQ